MIRIGVLSVNDRCARGEGEDEPGKRIQDLLPAQEYEVVEYSVFPGEVETIRVTLREWASRCDVILTAGGTGLGRRDVTPEATRTVLDRECPGIAEAIRANGYQKTPHALLSRGLAGTVGSCLVINLPGNAHAVQEGMDVLLPILVHAVDSMKTGGHR